MAINKVEYGGETLIDLTNDTVSEQTLVAGTTAHAANGEQITGTFNPSVYLEKTGDASNTTIAFVQASARANITTGEKLSTIFGKIKKFFADLKPVAFTGSASDLATGTLNADRLPSIPVKKLSGTISSANLPSYVDDVLEYSGKANFPAKGEAGKIYVDTATNLTYRWSGTAYVEISPSLALGTTSSTAYRGDYGNTAYQHSRTTGNPHKTTAADIGLGNVNNTADTDKSVKYAARAGNATKVNNHTVNADVPARAVFTDTWRGIQNNLTSDSTSDSLSAAQGKALKAAIDKNASDIEAVNNNLASIAYPYGAYSNVALHGYISRKQNDSTGNSRYLIFVPCPQSPAARFGVKSIRTLVIQGISILRQNATDQSGYALVNTQQDYQGITLSIDTANDISGYICECTFDFYTSD